MSWPRLRNLLLGLTSAVCLAFTAYVGYSLVARPEFRAVPIGGPFALSSHRGESVTDQSLRGQYLLIYFGYTSCPDICPTKLVDMTDGLDNFEQASPDLAAKVLPIFITVDPARDTRDALDAYMGHFHPRFLALTGPEADIAAAVGAYRASYRKVPGGDDDAYLMDHTSYVYLMAPDGRYLTHFTTQADADQIAAGLTVTSARSKAVLDHIIGHGQHHGPLGPKQC